MVMVTYRRCSSTRGSNCKVPTKKILVFWIGGRLREVVLQEKLFIRNIKKKLK